MSVSKESYMNVAEYGQWLYGYLPTGEVTAIIYHGDDFIKSYITEHTDYDETPLKDSFEAYVEGEEMTVPEQRYWNPETEMETFHESGKMTSALIGIPVPLKEYKPAFKRIIQEGRVNKAPCPLITNRFGDVYCHEDYTEQIRDGFLEFARKKHNA